MSLAVTVLKNSAVLLLFLLFISCGTKNKEYANNVFPYSQFPQEKELKGEVIELDTALFRYPFRIRIEGDKAIVLDLHGSDYYGHLFQYPSFRYLSSFGRRGDSPLEMLSMENFRLHNHTLWTLDANKSELTRLDFSSSGDSLLREETVALDEDTVVPMGTRVLFQCRQMPELKIGAEICEDVWAPNPPGVEHALAGATLLVNLSASDETTGKDMYRKSLVTGQSGRLICGYVYCSAGDGESTQDVVYSGHNLIAENGTLLAESRRFCNESIYTELDMVRLNEERRRMSTFMTSDESYINVEFSLKEEKTELTRFVDPAPFVPGNKADREKRCEEIFMIQAMGLKKRLEHTHAATAVVGISGGLDSTLALLVMVKAFDLIGKDHKDIVAVTMPGFGTTDRTYDNAVSLIKSLGATGSQHCRFCPCTFQGYRTG